jgi:hypothetical protein
VRERFGRGIAADFDECAPEVQAIPGVQTEQLYGGFAFVCERHDANSGQAEVLIPAVLTRMIQSRQAGRVTDEGSRISSFGDIAAQAREREIGRCGGAALFPADDMIDRKGERGVGLMN